MNTPFMIRALVLGIAVPALQTTETRPAVDGPYRIVSSSGREVRVDIGALRERGRSLQRATVLTPGGPVDAALVRTERVCEWLCGKGEEDGRECHFESLLRAPRPLERPLAVLAGRPSVVLGAPFQPGPEQPAGDAEGWIARTPAKTALARDLRWVRFPDGVYLALDSSGRDFYAPPIALTSCRQRAMAPFTVLRCGELAELLYEGARLAVASVADYSEASAEPLIRLRIGDDEAFLLRLGLKGQVVPALLMRAPDGWRLQVRPADYALMC